MTDPDSLPSAIDPPDPPEGPRTHAQASRERRDIVSGEVMPEAALIRFVLAPDGAVTPDLACKLPGRGLWVRADREALDAAVKRGAFSRAAKTKATAQPDLSDLVERLLMRRLLDGLGLARRAGELTSGFEKAVAAISAGRAAWLVEASDGAADGRRKLFQVVRRSSSPARLFGAFSRDDLSLALGIDPVVHLVFLAGRGAGRWTQDVDKLSGFRPLFPQAWPQTWREGPDQGWSE